MEITPKQIEEFKAIYKKGYGKELTDDEAYEGALGLLNFAKLALDQARVEHQRQKRLKLEPKGFPLEPDKTYNCLICHDAVAGSDGWWDKWGFKCMNCQHAVNKKTIPGKITRNRDLYYVSWELKEKFGLHPSTQRKMVREDKLKPKDIPGKHGVHFQIFLKIDNPFLEKISS